MEKLPLYSRHGKGGEDGMLSSTAFPADLNNINTKGPESNKNVDSLLEKAQQFSMFAVRQIEEARQELVKTADARFANAMSEDNPSTDDETNNFGGVNRVELKAAFTELTAAYDKLSLLKWDAVRKEYEAMCRVNLLSEGAQSSSFVGTNQLKGTGFGRTPKRETKTKEFSARDDFLESRGTEGNLWFDGGNISGPSWIASGFFNDPFSAMDANGGDDNEGDDNNQYPALGNLGTNWGNATPPPGFSARETNNANLEDLRGQGVAGDLDDSGHPSNNSDSKENTQSTSIPSEISSLHTSSHIQSDQESDSESITSTTDSVSSCQPPTPPVENFDYVYTGGYASRVANGKEIVGVVPLTVKHVLIDSTVTMIEDGAFQGCKALESVTISPAVESIGDNAFRKCSSLKSVCFLSSPSKHRNQGEQRSRKKSHEQNGAGEEKKTDKQTRRQSSKGSLSAISSSKSVSRSSKLFSIGEWAFFNCSSLTQLKLPDRLESIGTRAFQRCSALSLVEMPESLRYVGENAFFGCPRETKDAFDRWSQQSM